jgi:DNA-binding IclR family transcriptional regulator
MTTSLRRIPAVAEVDGVEDLRAKTPAGKEAPADGASPEVNERPASPAVARALGILEMLVMVDEPLTLTAIAEEAGIPLATCGAIMKTLEQAGFATRRIIGRSHLWQPTLRMFVLGNSLMRRYDVADVAEPALKRLAAAVDMPAHIGMLEGATVVYVAKAETPRFVQFNTYPGKAASFNLTALGRAIAANLAPDELAPLLDHLAAGRGPKSKRTGRQAFLTELAQIRVAGYAVEDEEEDAAISCIAAPVFGASGAVVASVGITGFAQEVMGDRFTSNVAAVVEAGREISRALGHTDLDAVVVPQR